MPNWTQKILTKSLENKLSVVAILYFMIGIIFGIFYAWYYHWQFVGYFSPGFYIVVFTWPYQAIGLFGDISYYGINFPLYR